MLQALLEPTVGTGCRCTVAVWGRIFHILRRWLLEYRKCSHTLTTGGDLEWTGLSC
ncbi:rCG22230 [Rattus norvegicus]|uniref:RCG22230 n=1 Tax=Rattus norvegicus TaxID=10116 RepID=A6INB9_RAT|nr:rCG22230 [Rattus norvegicus]